MRSRFLVTLTACTAVAVPLAMPQARTTTLKLTENEWGIAGVPATVKAGTKLAISVTNNGDVVHELVLERHGCAKQCVVKLKGHAAELENLTPGATKSTVWTILTPGRYSFTCRKPGHWKAGMHRTFTVS
jgi:uncharacterized cupredoxin-like copper-binding protein